MKTVQLTPAQNSAYDNLKTLLPYSNLIALVSETGMGRTTILKKLHQETGGEFLLLHDFLKAMHGENPLALEETFEAWLRNVLLTNDTVYLDDFHLFSNLFSHYHSPRYANFFSMVMASISDDVIANSKILILGSDCMPEQVMKRGFSSSLSGFEVEDYSAICNAHLSESLSSGLDYSKIHRYAPELNSHQLTGASQWLSRRESLTTEEFNEYLRSHYLYSNVDLDEVQAVELKDLIGIDDLIESLEANLILPMENTELAERFNLKPKRGVLLAGLPGTGKTTIGRALAHRMKSKFFLLDGTVISGTEDFYDTIGRIFELAKHNAPSILFIDDSDVIFESGAESGLYRYLLTMLDGLESKSAGRVCVMMTAMNVSNIPPALMRSGRVELWLETKLPDVVSRLTILKQRLAGLPSEFDSIETDKLSTDTEGLTGADLKRLVEDGKLLFAADFAKGATLKPITDYFLIALETLLTNKKRYATADSEAREKLPTSRPPWFDAGNP